MTTWFERYQNFERWFDTNIDKCTQDEIEEYDKERLEKHEYRLCELVFWTGVIFIGAVIVLSYRLVKSILCPVVLRRERTTSK